MSDDDFFVGYLPTAPRQKRRLRRLCLMLLIALIVCGVVLARGENDPGSGTWQLDRRTLLHGVLYARPYPMLLVHRDGEARLILLVNPGKHGAVDSAPGILDHVAVEATGHLLQRNDRSLLELDQPIKRIHSDLQPSLIFGSASSVDLVGEVIDPKCYAGAMKPGDGKTHKTCAALCLRGGIPPMFLSRDGRCFLLTDDIGNPVTGALLDQIAAVVGEPASARGELSESHGLLVLRLAPQGLRRLKS